LQAIGLLFLKTAFYRSEMTLKFKSTPYNATFVGSASHSVPTATQNQRREQIKHWMERCRAATLAQFATVDYDTFCRQAHADFSPVGWHLGHIAFTESLWIVEHLAGKKPSLADYRQLFAADGLSKDLRVHLPTFAEVCEYLEQVRSQTFAYLNTAPIDEQERLWLWLLQHESQHSETIALVLQLQQVNGYCSFGEWYVHPPAVVTQPLQATEMVEIPAGDFWQGSDAIAAQDNERPRHLVHLETYWIDRYPVTCAQYRTFMEAGGYCNSEWWSEAGWQWLQMNPVEKPLYWLADAVWDNHPVCGVSYYEAEAYARFCGKRLPTEAEWEKAASWHPQLQEARVYPWGNEEPGSDRCNCDGLLGHTSPVNAYPNGRSAYGCDDMLGNVWEWTTTLFDGYDGFTAYPYRGYSQAYFDQQHYVLRGGSWATRSFALRNSFRNWYHPHVRQVFVGFRCASSTSP
jgi:gamma-glutamyl hercynylcysteine S-oxide synthase